MIMVLIKTVSIIVFIHQIIINFVIQIFTHLIKSGVPLMPLCGTNGFTRQHWRIFKILLGVTFLLIALL